MREYNPATDFHVLEEAVANPKSKSIPPSLRDVMEAFRKHDLVWPVLNPTSGKPTEYASLVDREICRACEEQKWEVRVDGQPHHLGISGSWNDCWVGIHKASSGNSVDWKMKYDGYTIDPIPKEKQGAQRQPDLGGEA